MCVHTNTHHIRGETTIPTHVRLESHTHTQRAVTSMVLIPSYIQSPTPSHIRLESCTHTHIHTTCSYLNGSVFFLYPVLSSWQAHAQIRLAVTSMALFLSYIQSSPADRHTHRHDSQLPQWLSFLLISNPLQLKQFPVCFLVSLIPPWRYAKLFMTLHPSFWGKKKFHRSLPD